MDVIITPSSDFSSSLGMDYAMGMNTANSLKTNKRTYYGVKTKNYSHSIKISWLLTYNNLNLVVIGNYSYHSFILSGTLHHNFSRVQLHLVSE